MRDKFPNLFRVVGLATQIAGNDDAKNELAELVAMASGASATDKIAALRNKLDNAIEGVFNGIINGHGRGRTSGTSVRTTRRSREVLKHADGAGESNANLVKRDGANLGLCLDLLRARTAKKKSVWLAARQRAAVQLGIGRHKNRFFRVGGIVAHCTGRHRPDFVFRVVLPLEEPKRSRVLRELAAIYSKLENRESTPEQLEREAKPWAPPGRSSVRRPEANT